ncbi:MAG: MlaA family lipoprotein [Puniceicoccaceae bacterium]
MRKSGIRRRGRLLPWVALALALLAAAGVYRAHRLGAFHREPAFRGDGWRRVPVPAGAEDLAVVPGSGALLVSAGGVGARGGAEPGGGSLLLWRPGEAAPVRVRLDFDEPFRPHGIDCRLGEDGAPRVFAVNHRAPGERTVELFDIDADADPPAGRHVATIRDPRLTFPNDIAASGGRSFFVTNNPRHDSLIDRIRLALGLWGGQVLHYDDGQWTTVDDGIPFPNGILLSADGRRLFVAETLGGALRIYERPARTGKPVLRGRTPLGRGLDNIAPGPGGALWVAAHPDLPALGAHRRDPAKPSPWRLYRVREHGGGWRSRIVLRGDGSRMPGVSVGLPWDGRLILGGVADPALKIGPREPPAGRRRRIRRPSKRMSRPPFPRFPRFPGIFAAPRELMPDERTPAFQRHSVRLALAALAALAALLPGGCSATSESITAETNDPLEPFNRSMHAFNDSLDRHLIGPAADAYGAVTPSEFRRMVRNFAANLDTPFTSANQLLQGKPVLALSDLARFVVNSTVGIGGLFDPATPIGLERHDEDIGQTLAVWGVGAGPYLVLPVVGPTTLRNSPSVVVDNWARLRILRIADAGEWLLPIDIARIVNERADDDPLARVRKRAIDPYVFIREAYLERRRYLVHDGDPPAGEAGEEAWEVDIAFPEDDSAPAPESGGPPADDPRPGSDAEAGAEEESPPPAE